MGCVCPSGVDSHLSCQLVLQFSQLELRLFKVTLSADKFLLHLRRVGRLVPQFVLLIVFQGPNFIIFLLELI